MHMRSPQHGTQMGQFPAIFRRITLYSPSQSTKLISWKKRESRVPGLYSDANCKVSCCPDSLQDKQGSVACAGDAHQSI